MSNYSYTEKKYYLNKQFILDNISQEEIYKMALGYTPQEYQYLVSPFRQEDQSPGCYFEWFNGLLYFIDWAEPEKVSHRDCFNFIQDYYKVSFYGAITLIMDYFQRAIKAKTSIMNRSTQEPVKKVEKIYREIPFKVRSFESTRDGDFWGKRYDITREQLMEDNVFPIIWYKIYSKKLNSYVVIRPDTVSYLVGKFEDRIKIYTPHAPKIGKWVTNCTKDDLGGYDSLPEKGEKLVLTKSYKDYRILKNEGVAVLWLQNEGMFPSMELLYPLFDRFEEIIVLFDNDSAGIKAADKLTLIINKLHPDKARSVHVPKYLLKDKISDPSDLYHKKGRKSYLGFLKKYNII